ncbi:hypothetical protein N7481_002062 [Penicillium waksmanii]|uniref:uncharacterized protein n=1 Tax=Penicillium waksmanii TaxID=69791 RepID=UPI0025485C4A|nr:uncharacterized protein N7481_002062 [Penicillium waksmanii]KAJ5995085.1 hypothetical protein N7481_002062 [Penicillium waksmanii]
MSPSILIVGATGNTGRAVTQTLPKLLQSSRTLSGHRIIVLTRCSANPATKELAKLPGVEVIEKNWVELPPRGSAQTKSLELSLHSTMNPTSC